MSPLAVRPAPMVKRWAISAVLSANPNPGGAAPDGRDAGVAARRAGAGSRPAWRALQPASAGVASMAASGCAAGDWRSRLAALKSPPPSPPPQRIAAPTAALGSGVPPPGRLDFDPTQTASAIRWWACRPRTLLRVLRRHGDGSATFAVPATAGPACGASSFWQRCDGWLAVVGLMNQRPHGPLHLKVLLKVPDPPPAPARAPPGFAGVACPTRRSADGPFCSAYLAPMPTIAFGSRCYLSDRALQNALLRKFRCDPLKVL
jgi:hypothetical protein